MASYYEKFYQIEQSFQQFHQKRLDALISSSAASSAFSSYDPNQAWNEYQQYLSYYQELLSLKDLILQDNSDKEITSILKVYQTWKDRYLTPPSSSSSSSSTATIAYYHHQQQKLPAGTNQVVPNITTNFRFLLSRITFLMALTILYCPSTSHYDYEINQERYEFALKESYVFYPKSVQVLFTLAEYFKVTGNRLEKLME